MEVTAADKSYNWRPPYFSLFRHEHSSLLPMKCLLVGMFYLIMDVTWRKGTKKDQTDCRIKRCHWWHQEEIESRGWQRDSKRHSIKVYILEDIWMLKNCGGKYSHPAIPFSIALILMRVVGELEPISGDFVDWRDQPRDPETERWPLFRLCQVKPASLQDRLPSSASWWTQWISEDGDYDQQINISWKWHKHDQPWRPN